MLVKYVAICVRVCRECHQSGGGTDVVDLPDVLLPEDQYLDMFDSESDFSGDFSHDELVELPWMQTWLVSIYLVVWSPLCFSIHPMVCLVVST